jgi:hypothetical protein
MCSDSIVVFLHHFCLRAHDVVEAAVEKTEVLQFQGNSPAM